MKTKSQLGPEIALVLFSNQGLIYDCQNSIKAWNSHFTFFQSGPENMTNTWWLAPEEGFVLFSNQGLICDCQNLIRAWHSGLTFLQSGPENMTPQSWLGPQIAFLHFSNQGLKEWFFGHGGLKNRWQIRAWNSVCQLSFFPSAGPEKKQVTKVD